MAADISSVLTVVGNAIRFPAHMISNKDLRQYISRTFCKGTKKVSLSMEIFFFFQQLSPLLAGLAQLIARKRKAVLSCSMRCFLR